MTTPTQELSLPVARSHLTLGLATLLHMFTHAYGSMLVPLYLLMQSDLHLPGVRRAALIVTVYGLVYNLGSYAAGMLADRLDRKVLLGVGLIGNAAAIAGMGLTHNYPLLLALGVAAGIFGTLFHPSANALIPAHYPRNPGMAIGLLGMGSGLGFFLGPQYAGWRAAAAHWHFASVADWQRPCVELGVAGIFVGILFLLVAREAVHGAQAKKPPLGRRMRRQVIALASVLAFRDFAGVATISLASIYLQLAWGMPVKHAGLIVGEMMLVGVVANPLAVYLSPGRRRLIALPLVLVCGAIVVVTTPFWPVRGGIVAMCIFQTFQLGSYAISDAAMLERVAPELRGRVVGLFLVIAGTFSSLGPWVMGAWADLLGERSHHPLGYIGPFATIGVMMLLASASPRFIAALGPAVGGPPIGPADEINPATMESVL